jgi:hypothetical protein
MAKTAMSPDSMTHSTPTHDEIAAQAYQIYLREGGAGGRDMDHWLQAEAELRERGSQSNGATAQSNGQSQAGNGTLAVVRNEPAAPILPNSVMPPTAPIAQVTRAGAPRKGPGKRETAVAK